MSPASSTPSRQWFTIQKFESPFEQPFRNLAASQAVSSAKELSQVNQKS
jgi:hypothetical protein